MPLRAVPSALRKIAAGAAAVRPVGDLFVAVTAYKLAEILFFSFTLAYAFSLGGFRLALASAWAVAILLTVGYWVALVLMARSTWRSRHMLRIGSVGTCLCIGAAGLVDGEKLSLAALVSAAVPAGGAYAAKQWNELTRTQGALRESYLSFGQSVWALLRVAVLASCAALLAVVDNDFRIFFFVAGLTAATAIAVAGPLKRATAVADIPRPFPVLRTLRYWRNSSFFMLESGAMWLRDLVAVCGAMTLVSSASLYGWLETASSLTAAATMAWLAGRRIERPSIARLQLGLAGAILAWLSYAGSLVWPPFFAAFIVLRALSTPVMAASYDSLVMRSVERSGSHLQSNALAREVTLLVGRCATFAVAGAVTLAAVPDPRAALLASLGLTLLALPAEYLLACRMARRRA